MQINHHSITKMALPSPLSPTPGASRPVGWATGLAAQPPLECLGLLARPGGSSLAAPQPLEYMGFVQPQEALFLQESFCNGPLVEQ